MAVTSPAAAPQHDGLLGPDSVAWRVIGHPAALVGGLRALIVQSLHPLAMAGVAEHSDFRARPLARLRGTAYYVGATCFGDRATAEAAAATVRRIHRHVRGIDPVTGQPYSADDPETALWVHTVEWHSFLAAYRAYGGRLSAAEQDRYLAEGARIAALLGVPRPTSRDGRLRRGRTSRACGPACASARPPATRSTSSSTRRSPASCSPTSSRCASWPRPRSRSCRATCARWRASTGRGRSTR
jgi:uncharacterized protein (DUF2236 family)